MLLALTKAKKGGFVSRYLQLYNGFLVSALIHHAGSLNMTFHAAIRYQFLFFMVQPVAITMEDFAIYLGKRQGLCDTCKHLPSQPFPDRRDIDSQCLLRDDESHRLCMDLDMAWLQSAICCQVLL